MTPRQLVVWGYIVEIMLSLLVFGVLLLFWSSQQLVEFILGVASDFAAFFSTVMLAGSIAFLWVYYSKSDTAFAGWLYKKGAFHVYLTAYIFAVAVYAILTVVLLLSKHLGGELISLIALWLLVLGAINTYSFIRNIVDQLKLNMEFNRVNNEKL